jgi:hypothetical protein
MFSETVLRNGIKYDFWIFCAFCVERRWLFFLDIPLLDTTCFDLTVHLQVYRLLWFRILLLLFSSSYCSCLWIFWLCGLQSVLFGCSCVARDCFRFCLVCSLWQLWMLLLGREFCCALVGHHSRSLAIPHSRVHGSKFRNIWSEQWVCSTGSVHLFHCHYIMWGYAVN